jgi:hypothetical protein
MNNLENSFSSKLTIDCNAKAFNKENVIELFAYIKE